MALLGSKNSRTITGKTVTGRNVKPTVIKPSKTRKIIRRFHFLIRCRKTLIKLLMELSIQQKSQLHGCKDLLKIQDADEEQNYNVLTNFFVKNKTIWNKDFRAGSSSSSSSSTKDSKNDLEDKLLKLKSDIKPGMLFGSESNTGKLGNKCQEYIQLLQYITDEIHTNGGLQKYQLASIMGQDTKRGGDSSKFLIKWLNELNDEHRKLENSGEQTLYHSMHALEIGCLNANNYISRSPKLISSVERIDLNSNDTGLIKKQDFMERPLPGAKTFKKKTASKEVFDLISCSMVLNFVPDDTKRGAMLKRIKCFLRSKSSTNTSTTVPGGLLFLVLPLPCINNSRYMSDDYFVNTIMLKALNFSLLKKHQSHKIIYYLFEETEKRVNDAFIKKTLTKRSLCFTASTTPSTTTPTTTPTTPGKTSSPKNDKNKNNFCILF
ncbi:hypothetical protein ACO0QE_001486 [Hanseniaspora vineae]